jgi:cytoskeletal protein RodZ
MRRFGLVGAWVLVAMVATTLTWQIVSAADDQVSDRPVAALDLATLDSTTSSSTVAVTETSDTVVDPSTTTTTQGTSSSTTTVQSTTAPTTGTVAWQVRKIDTGGGTVVVGYRPGEVVLQSAAPNPGFSAEVKKGGPPDVEVEFEGESAKYEVKAKWSDGQLSIESDQDAED